MGQTTDIQWCDSTVNPTSGCDGCELKVPGKPGSCYAVPIHTNRLARSFPANYSADFHEVRMIPGRMAKTARMSDLRGKDRPDKPWLNGMPRMIFVGDLSDLLSKAVPFEFIDAEVFDTARIGPGARHIYMLLTKQPSRAAELGRWLKDRGKDWPDNVWIGTSITTQKTAGNRIRKLLDVPARNRYLSIEPLAEEVSVAEALWVGPEGGWEYYGSRRQMISLVICGGESGPNARPLDVQWALKLRDQCRDAGVPFFLKQLGARPYDSKDRISIDGPGSHAIEIDLRDSHGGDWDEWPADLRVREFPAMVTA